MINIGPPRVGPIPLIPIKHAGRPARVPILEGYKPDGNSSNNYNSKDRRDNYGTRSPPTSINEGIIPGPAGRLGGSGLQPLPSAKYYPDARQRVDRNGGMAGGGRDQNW